MTQILLIRHAATEAMTRMLCGRTLGFPLSSFGKAQALTLAKRLASHDLKAIYSSPLERAMETAAEIARFHQLSPAIEERFTELDFGDWTGKTFAELQSDPLWNEYNRTRSKITPPGGESPLRVLDRCRRVLSELANRHAGQEIAVITHADVIRSALTSLLDMPLDHLLRFEVAPASVTEVSVGSGEPVIHSLNVRCPFEA